MSRQETPELEAFRTRVRQFIAENLPPELQRRDKGRGVFDQHQSVQDAHPESFKRWRAALRQARWLAPAWPGEYGGGGLDSAHQYVLNEEFIQAGAPRVVDIGLGMAGPTIIFHGTEQQK